MALIRKKTISLLLALCVLLSMLCMAPAAFAAEAETPAAEPAAPQELAKVTVQLTREPVVLLPVSDSVASVSSRNATLLGLTWYDESGNVASGSFEYKKYRAEIRVKADEGYVFAANLQGYINNAAVKVQVAPDGQTATLIKECMAVVWSPNIMKHPGDEPVQEGGWVSYVSTALYATSLTWEITNPDGDRTVDTKDIHTVFPYVAANNNGVDKIVFSNVPMEMDGWSVRAVFHGAQDTVTRSRPTVIKVIADPNSTPAPAPAEQAAPVNSAAPEPTPTPELTPTPEPTPTPEESPAPHEHAFAETWSFDDNSHWHECAEDGERADEAAHSLEWQEVEPATRKAAGLEKGVCAVCGYETTRELAYNGGGGALQSLPFHVPVLVLLGLILALVIVQEVSVRRRGRR